MKEIPSKNHLRFVIQLRLDFISSLHFIFSLLFFSIIFFFLLSNNILEWKRKRKCFKLLIFLILLSFFWKKNDILKLHNKETRQREDYVGKKMPPENKKLNSRIFFLRNFATNELDFFVVVVLEFTIELNDSWIECIRNK